MSLFTSQSLLFKQPMVILMTSNKLHLIKTHLSVAVFAGLCAQTAFANTQPSTHLGELQVHAYQGAKLQSNVVTTKLKDESTDTNLRGLLSKEPAIDFGGGTGSSQYLTIRGMGQNSVDLKVDNAHSDSQILYHQGRFILDPSLVKIVSVQKGAGSASAGIGATNGSIIAKTLDAQDLLKNSTKNYGAKINLGYSNNNSHNYGATVFGRMSSFDALLSYNAKNESNFRPGRGFVNGIDGGNYVPYSALDTSSYLAKLGYNFANHRFVLSHMKDEQAGVRTVREEFSVDNRERVNMERQAPAYRKNSLSNTNLEWTANNLGFVEKANANAYVMNNTRYSADDKGCGYCGNIEGPTTTTISTKGANLNLDVEMSNDVLVKYGINYRHQQITPPFKLSKDDKISVSWTEKNPTTGKEESKKKDVLLGINVVDPEKTDIGVYAEAIKDFGNITTTAGLRYDHFSFKAMDGKQVSSGSINPSLGVIWQATPQLRLSTNHNIASRSPRMYDALLAHGKRGITSIDSNIKAEKAHNTELGLDYVYSLANGGNLTLKGGYFWQTINDALVAPQNRHAINNKDASIGTELTKDIVNAGQIKNHGYELGLSYQQDAITARIGVADSNPKFYLKANSIQPEFGAPVGRTWTASLAYRFANPNLEVGIKNRTVEESKATLLVGAPLETRAGYSVTDVFANWKPYNSDKMNVNLSINNVGDKFYYPHSQRASITTLAGVGREFRVGVNYNF